MKPPVRWKEAGSDAPPELRAVLKYAQTREPDAAQTAALTDAVLRQLPQVGATPSAGTLGAGAKLAALALVGALGGVLGVRWYAAVDALSAKPVPAAATVATPNAAPALTSTPPVAAPATTGSVQTPHAAPPAEGATAARALSAPRRALPNHAAPEAPARPAHDELTLLHAARLARRNSPTTALALLREHERDFPESAFREEREALIIEQLQHIDPAQASARLAAFEARYPRSVYRQRIDIPRR